MNFELLTAQRILFGPGSVAGAFPQIRSLGARPLVVTGKTLDRAGPIIAPMRKEGIEPEFFSVPAEPTIEHMRTGVELARRTGRDVVVGIGGGSVLDGAKAVAGLAPNPGDILDYLEVIGAGRPLSRPALPIVAVPTTAGTGAEVTQNAVLGSVRERVKVSLRNPGLLPRAALVDAELMMNAPLTVAAYSGLDALTQVVEPFIGRRRNPLIDALCRDALARAAKALPRLLQAPRDLANWEELSLVSLIGGFALTNAGLGAVHGFAGPLGGMTGGPHGAICARLLPFVFEVNRRALSREGDPEGFGARLNEVGRLLTGNSSAGAADAVCWLEDCATQFQIPPLSRWGFRHDSLDEAVEKALRASSMKGNPIQLSREELREILERALD